MISTLQMILFLTEKLITSSSVWKMNDFIELKTKISGKLFIETGKWSENALRLSALVMGQLTQNSGNLSPFLGK